MPVHVDPPATNERSRLVEYKALPLEDFEIKAGDGGWTFTAYASTFGNKDHGGDVIQPGAFKSTLTNPNRDRPLLWQHQQGEPIGRELSIAEDKKGLLGTWEIIDTARGADAYKLLKRGVIRSMSIGYIPKTFDFTDGGDGRVLKEIDLLENSVVSVPMNDQARVQSVKSHCEVCHAAALAGSAAPKYDSLTLAQLAGVVTEVSDLFSERTKGLLAKLATGEHELTENKRADLEALLETFSRIDAVRHEAEEVLAHKPTIDPKNDQVSAIALALEMRRRRARILGVEV